MPYLALLLALSAAAAGGVRPADYIVVGSGPGGCAVAARLCAALPDAHVVLLERGTPPMTASERLMLRAPRLAYRVLRSRFVLPTETAPNPGLNGRRVTMLEGNVLGGLSAANAGQWTRPRARDAARWGFRGLTAARARALLRRAEGAVRPAVAPRPLRHALAPAWLAAAHRAGFAAGSAQGGDAVFDSALAVDAQGRRRDACAAYLAPVRGAACRRSLRVVQGAEVTRVLLSAPGRSGRRRGRRRVKGVEYVRAGARGGTRVLRARREVILAAGAVGSPGVLLRSGVGPRAVLLAGGVEPVVELPVGQNVSSRVTATVVSVYTGVPTVRDNLAAAVESAAARARFRAGRGGVLGKAISSVNGRFGTEFLLAGGNAFDLADPAGRDQPLIVSICSGQPGPVGSITLRGGSRSLRLALNFLGGEGEADRLAKCIAKLREVHSKLAPELKAFEVRPGANVTVIDGDVARDNGRVGYHVVGGCAVGKVIEDDFRLKGVDGVRVVDSSVIPTMPVQAGPMSSVYMLAELASELIVQSYRRGC